jgi:hypothetical protein
MPLDGGQSITCLRGNATSGQDLIAWLRCMKTWRLPLFLGKFVFEFGRQLVYIRRFTK